MRRFLARVALIAFLAGSSPLLYCQAGPTLDRLIDYLNFKMHRDHIPGLTVGIVQDDHMVWSRGFGFQDVRNKTVMTPQTVVGTASITKLITAIAVMQLQEQGLVDLDRPINTYLPIEVRHPGFPDADITVAQVLSHTSSISNGPSLWRCFSCAHQKLDRSAWIHAYFLPGGEYYHKEGNFGSAGPGKEFIYSNAGFELLAYLVEVVSNVTYEEYCRTHIFAPLKMDNTGFDAKNIRPSSLSTMYAYGYQSDLERDLLAPGIDYPSAIETDYFFPLCDYTSSTPGAGGMYSSVEQLSHLLIALMHGGIYESVSVLHPESVTRILGDHVGASLLPGKFAAFGLGGYALQLCNGARVWGHTGADPGTSSFLLFNPETKVGAIVISNRFVDIRDLIEWTLAEGISEYSVVPLEQLGGPWKVYAKETVNHSVTFNVLPDYLPGGSQLHVIGDHRYLGAWVRSGIPLTPAKDRFWSTTVRVPDSTKIEFKITRGEMDKEAVTRNGKVLPNHSLVVVKDTVVTITVEDWKDQAQ